ATAGVVVHSVTANNGRDTHESNVAVQCPPGRHSEHEANGGKEADGGKQSCQLDGIETPMDIAAAQAQLDSRRTAPVGAVRAGAYESALAQRNAMVAQGAVTAAATQWKPLGTTPYNSNVAGYGRTNGLGMRELSGRIEDLAYDTTKAGRYLAVSSNGGVWETTNSGANWHSIGDNLPTQVIGTVAVTSPAKGKSNIVVGTGDPAYGGNSESGLGAFYSTNGGATWTKSAGYPSGLSFAMKVDPTNPSVIYAGTSKGLYRSSNAGASFNNVVLPTKCTKLTDPTCFFANMVTDVVVRAKDANGRNGGKVLAAVGWRAGQKPNYQGKPQSPQNGIYSSPTGKPGTFTYVNPANSGFLSTALTGRVTLAVANGAGQNHNYVAAVVQDAGKFNGSNFEFDAPDAGGAIPNGTVLNGIYISTDFGDTWSKTADAAELATPLTGTALVGANTATYRPGVQSWYNQYVEFDPTRKDASGKPTRMSFGLEEVWENNGPILPAHTQFKVIGRYFAGGSCLGLNLGLPLCPTNQPTNASSTTHPDQHAGMFVPDGKGGVTLVVGNDGGAYTQHTDAVTDFSNDQWGDGANKGFHDLQPYAASMAKDGTTYMGLQDNGEGKITPKGDQIAVYGGDGFFTSVDPDNSNIAYEEYTGGQVSVTTDGGKSWTSINPSLTSPMFSTPFAMDRIDATHLLIGGRDIQERQGGPSGTWTKVYDLGTRTQPGNAAATSSAGDPNNQLSAVDQYGQYAAVGFCGYCDLVTQGSPFKSGIATNVLGSQAPERGTSKGWHIASATGLPNRYVTSVQMDPANPAVMYATLGGYGRRWVPPGALGDSTAGVGVGHVFRSVDAGEHFTDISANLPDVPANWSLVRAGHLVVATDIGVFQSTNTTGGSYSQLGGGLPTAPVFQLTSSPADTSRLVAATFGRGVYTFEYPGGPTPPPGPGGTTTDLGSWDGTIAPGTNPTSECPAPAAGDAHTINYTAPPVDPNTVNTSLTFTITWTPASPGGETTSDEILTVFDSAGKALASSDGSSTSESVSLSNPPSGSYTAVSCGFANAVAQPYHGSASVTTADKPTAPPPH
ncbi:MAG: hypothetical protein WCB04_06830, partial [Mycobacteriales bacterium]